MEDIGDTNKLIIKELQEKMLKGTEKIWKNGTGKFKQKCTC